MQTIELIAATKERNGLVAVQKDSTHNPNMWTISKISMSGRFNGTVYRYNKATGRLIMDGGTWRNYVNYDHITDEELLKICNENI